jgi:hypothetical protein
MALMLLPAGGVTQAGAQALPRTNLGLPAVSAIGIFGGGTRIERSSNGLEFGGLIDLGWMNGRSLRLQGEVGVVRAPLTEFVEPEDSTYTGHYLDLSVDVTGVWLASPDGRASPYVLAGIGVHALSSTFGTLYLDRRYNANRFGSHVGAGLRVRLGGGRIFQPALFVEARRVIADEVDRTVLRAGLLTLLGDLGRR